jgi:hypothetical protein
MSLKWLGTFALLGLLVLLVIPAAANDAPQVLTTATLAPTEAPVTQATPAASSAPIPLLQPGSPPNATVNGTLTTAAPSAVYSFPGSLGQIVDITLISTDFDAYLELRGPDGASLATDDDSAGSLNARIQSFALPVAGQYEIQVGSFAGNAQGDYNLLLMVATVDPMGPTPTPTPAPLEPTPAPATVEPTIGGAISMGDTLAGALTLDAQTQTYTFSGESGQVVTIEATSEQFDVFLTLNDGAGLVLMSDDDSAGNLNARISEFRLPVNGDYSIVVSSFSSGVAGEFMLSLLQGGIVQPTPVPTSDGTLSIGQSVDGIISDSSGVRYTFAGETGQSVSITAISEAFDTYLSLLAPDGSELATDDDSAGNLDSRIGPVTLASSGTYTVLLTSFDSSFGAYTITLSAIEVRPIEMTQTIEDSLEINTSAAYTFTGEAGDVITAHMSSPDFDTYIVLADSTGLSLAENDDAGGGTNSMIGPYTLPYSGQYQINVRSYDSTAFGSYTLSLERAALLDIAFDEPQTTTFDAENSAFFYRFNGEMGDVINVVVMSNGSVDTSLKLNGPDGYELSSDDDGGPGFDPELFKIVLSQSGAYILALQSNGGSGSTQITVSRQPTLSLDDGTQIVSLSDKQYQGVVSFEGRAGEEVQLAVRVLEGSGSAPNLTITQGDTSLATAYATDVVLLTVAFTVPEDGQVNVQLSDYNYATSTLEVTLTR